MADFAKEIIIYHHHSIHTDHTIMPLTNLRVHIAPVGFEIDRIVLPAKQMKRCPLFSVE